MGGASQVGHVGRAWVLFEQSFDVRVQDKNKWTELCHVFDEGHYRRQGTNMWVSRDCFTIALGVECKIFYFWRPSCEKYPIDLGIQEFHKFWNVGREEVARVVLQHGAEANARDIFGSTPL